MLKKIIVLLLIFFTLSMIVVLSYHSQYIIVNLREMSMMQRNYSKQFVMDHVYTIEVTTGSLNSKTETLAKSITKQYIHQTKCRGRCGLRESSEDRLQKSKSCPDPSPHLVGPFRVEFSTPRSWNSSRNENPNVMEGGRYQPDDCIALQKVAIIIPFRKRHEHLKFWIHYLHPFLQRQQLDYGIYVINQDGDGTFNRAKLMNIGYAEALKEYDYDCFVFSDVDLIPMDDRNAYKCFSQPRHLSVAVDSFGFRLPYSSIFGGVTALNKEQYQKINGFPNDYWGWGGEDDDISNRITLKGMTLSRPDGQIGKYRMIRHNRDAHNEPNPQRFNRILHTRTTINSDGINSLKYTVVKLEKGDLFTTITVDVGTP